MTISTSSQHLAELQRRFASELGRVDGRVSLAGDENAAASIVAELVVEKKGKLVVAWPLQDLPCGNLAERLREIGVIVHETPARDGLDPARWSQTFAQHRKILDRADIGITGADFAIAETGTIVLVHRGRHDRGPSLLPPVHVAIVNVERLVARLDDLSPYLSKATAANITFVTGPSRTADIEQTLTLGAHGPREVHVILVGAASD